MTQESFARPEYLVDAAWVAAHSDDPNVVVVDCDVDAAYARGHIPGAALVPDSYQKDPDNPPHLMSPDQFKAMCEGLGIGDDTVVIAYDNRQSVNAARFWWALNTYGHSEVKVLDGGWRGWVTEGREVSFAKPRVSSNARFTPNRDESMLVKVDELKAACSLDDSVIWDVRSDEEWDGSEARGNKRAGHIPGAVHLEWFNLMDRETHRFKPPGEIRNILAEAGITPDKTAYTY